VTASPSAPTIVVGYDGSQASRAAVGYAARRAGPEGTLVLVYGYGSSDPRSAFADREEHARGVLEGVLLEGNDELADVTYATELSGEPPAEAIVTAARAHDADEIVVGSRSFGRVRGALGSVSHDLVHLADRPLVVIPGG
jgi:nucleotide-binding universal stress UspA family protein